MIEIEADDYMPRHDYNNWNIEDSTYPASNLSYQKFFENHLIKNMPCIIQNVITSWECFEKWIENDDINYEYLAKTYGDLEAPVADCNDILDYAQRTTVMKVREFLNYMQSSPRNSHLYLKDFHLKKIRPNDNFYVIPLIFSCDWLNEHAYDKNEDDFKFVYIGPKGSWTPLHADVYCSYSWSVNVTGRKKWTLFPPGEEKKLKDKQSQLQLLFDKKLNVDVKHYEVIQEKGDALFVPSGWYHQVENQLDTISINHNWNNGCNIHFMWEVLNQSLNDVEHEIGQFKDSPNYYWECQNLLKALCGANFESYINLITYIARKRLTQLTGQINECVTPYFGANQLKFDLKMILNVMDSILSHPNYCMIQEMLKNNNNFAQLKQEIEETLTNFKQKDGSK